MALELIDVINGSNPNDEIVRLKITAPFKTKGFAIVDRTFDEEGRLSNEYRHIYIFPDLDIKKEMNIYLRSGKGKDEIAKFKNNDKEYYRLYWGADSCVWNNKGGETATLINFIVVDSVKVPAIEV